MISAAVVLRMLWPFFVVGGCGYAVFGLGYSGWWFLLAVMLLG